MNNLDGAVLVWGFLLFGYGMALYGMSELIREYVRQLRMLRAEAARQLPKPVKPLLQPPRNPQLILDAWRRIQLEN